jgi:hypothetical protein
MYMSRHQNAGLDHGIERANKSFKNVSYFKYLRTTVTIKFLFQCELRIDWILVTLAIIRSSNFCPIICCLKT